MSDETKITDAKIQVRWRHIDKLGAEGTFTAEQVEHFQVASNQMLEEATKVILRELHETGAPNYFCTVLIGPDTEWFELTLRRGRGQSPIDQLRAAEREIKILREEVERLGGVL